MRSSPPWRSWRARSCAAGRSSSAATRTAAASSRPRTTRPGATGSSRRCRAPKRCGAARPSRSCGRVWASTASTRRRCGRSCARSCRPSSRPGSTRATSTSASSRPPSTTRAPLAEAVQAAIRVRTRLSCSLGLASSKVVAKIASDRRKPGGLTIVRPGQEAAFLAPLAIRLLPGVGPRAEARLAAGGVETIGGLAALVGRAAWRAPAGEGRPARARPRPRHRPAAARGLDRAHLDLARGDVPAGRRRPRAAARRARPDGRSPRGAPARPRSGRAHGDDEAPLSRLRDPHPLDLAPGRHRRPGAHRRARVRSPRPRTPRPAGPAAARRCRCLGHQPSTRSWSLRWRESA